MTINFRGMRANDRKSALNTISDSISDADHKREVKAILKGQKITNIVQLLMLRDTEIETMDLLEEAVDDQGQKIITTTVVSKVCLSTIKDLKDFTIFLSNVSTLTDVKDLTTDHFEDWQYDRVLKGVPVTPGTPVTPAGQAPAPAPATANADTDLSRQIEAINKLEVKSIPHWNGSVGDYPRTMRVTRQVFKNYGMAALVKTTTTAPANDGSLKWKLWERQNNFACTSFMVRFTGGQASILVRKHSEEDSCGLKIYKEIVNHYESPANKAAAITHIMAQLSQLTYTTRSNYSIIIHLTKFQNFIQDLEDCQHTGTSEVQIKSMLCNSIKHPAFQNLIDGYLINTTSSAQMITELTQKAERMSKSTVSKRNINYGQQSGNKQKKKGDSQWWKEPAVWATMSDAEKADHLKQKSAYYAKKKKDKSSNKSTSNKPKTTPVPASNYGSQINDLQTVMQLVAMTDDQRSKVHQITSQLSQVNMLQQQLHSAQQTATTATPPASSPASDPNGGNLLTRLMNAQSVQQPDGTFRLQFNVNTKIVENPDVPKTKTRNPDLPTKTPLGLRYLVDTTDMEESELTPYSDWLPEQCSTADDSSLNNSSVSDSVPTLAERVHNDTSTASSDDGSVDDWSTVADDISIASEVDQPATTTFLDNIQAVDQPPELIDRESFTKLCSADPEYEHFSDALEAPLADVADELEIFQDAQEELWFEPDPSSLVPPMDLCCPDTFLFTDKHVICGIRQSHFTLTRFLGGTEIFSDGYSPVDSGADTIFCGTDCRNEEIDDSRKVEVVGCHGSTNKCFNLGTNLTAVTTTDGEQILLRMNESICGAGKTLFAANQLRAAGHVVDDVPRRYGGTQRVKLYDGPTIPLYYKQGLCHIKTTYPTDKHLQELPVFDLTLDIPWNPMVECDDDEVIAPDDIRDVNAFATKYIMMSDDAELRDDVIAAAEAQIDETYDSWMARLNKLTTKLKQVDWDRLIPCFAWKPQHVIEKTLENTTQYYRTTSERLPMRQYFKSRTPALRVTRINERVSTDWIDSSVPSINGGFTGAQIFYRCTSHVLTAMGGHGPGSFPDNLRTYIKEEGAPHTLMSDGARVEASKVVNDIARKFVVKQRYSAPQKQNQNPVERPIQDLKKDTVKLLDRTGAPDNLWYYGLLFIVLLHNLTAQANLGWKTPLEKATGVPPDISAVTKYHWYQPIYYYEKGDDYAFPDSKELIGRWLGPCENTGDIFCSYVLTGHDTVIKRSVLRPAYDQPLHHNRRQVDGEALLSTSYDKNPNLLASDDEIDTNHALEFDPQALIGYEFIHQKDGHGYRAKVTDYFENQKKFMIALGDGNMDEIVSYNEMIDAVNKRLGENKEPGNDAHEVLWFLESIVDHKLNSDKKTYSVKVKWSTGEETWEPLKIIAEDDPVTCAKYGKDNDLLDLPGWKRFKRLASREKKFIRMLRQAFASKRKNATRYKFGVRIPKNLKEAKELDRANGNTLWQDALKKEMDQIKAFQTFKDLGKGAKIPHGYQRVHVHIIWDCKYDLRRKARLVCSGNLTPPTTDNAYSGIVSLDGVRTVMFLAELNDLQLCAADIGNAYLTSKTREKLAIIAGPEFGDLEGHTLMLVKALYGTRTGGNRFAEKLADDLLDLGFFQSLYDPAIWMRDCGDHYEYLCTWVDDLMFASKNPMWLMEKLEKKYNYTLKGVGAPEYYLGADIKRVDKDVVDNGVLTMGSTTYVKRCLENYERLLGLKPPKKVAQPMDTKYHPELDTTDLLDSRGRQIYWSLIGMLQWAVTIGRIDIHHAVMCMSRFRAEPRKGHLQAVSRIFGYLSNYKTASIKFRTGIPDYSKFVQEQQTDFDWSYIYGKVKELVPEGLPAPKGKKVKTSHFVDANLGHDKVTGRSCSGIITMFNLTPIDWFCKLQNTVETASYSSEFTVARQGVDKILAERFKLRALGVPIDGPAYMFGDNKSVVLSASIPTHGLNKRHNFLSFHRVRECIAATHNGEPVIRFFHIDGKDNPADVQTKTLPGSEIYRHMKPWLHWVDRTDNSHNSSQQMGSVKMAG